MVIATFCIPIHDFLYGPRHAVASSTTRYLGGGFKYFLFSPLPGEMIQFDEHITVFQMGWFNHHLGMYPPFDYARFFWERISAGRSIQHFLQKQQLLDHPSILEVDGWEGFHGVVDDRWCYSWGWWWWWGGGRGSWWWWWWGFESILRAPDSTHFWRCKALSHLPCVDLMFMQEWFASPDP